MNETIKDLHRDLARKFQRYGPQLEQLWRSFDQERREKVLREGAHEGIVLKDPQDTSMGNVYKLIPEWNLYDITSPSSDFLLDMIKHRANTPLQDQYLYGINGGLGDYEHITDMMRTKNLKLIDASKLKNCYTLFVDGEQYGKAYEVDPAKKDEFLAGLVSIIPAQLIIPQAIGDLILMRQNYLLQSLNIVIEDILDNASNARSETKRIRKPTDIMITALARLSFHALPKKLDLSDLIDSALDQKSSLEDFIDLISTEPTILAHEVNASFFTRPELVADERGRRLPVHTDKYISGAVFDAIHGIIKTAAIWNYLSRLLDLLKGSVEKQLRAIVSKELSIVCHLEYTRAQATFRRHVSTGSGGDKWFKRMVRVQKNGVTRIAMKRNPDSLTVENPQLHYMLRLCQDDMDWSKSTQWLQKIEDLHRAYPLEKEKMREREFDSLGDLAIIVTFIQSLSSVVPLPAINRKREQLLVSKFSALENELEEIKSGIDLSNFCIPIANLLEPGMATGALTALDEYVLEKTGTKLGSLYEDLVDDCASNIFQQYEQQKANSRQAKVEYTVPTAPEVPESRIQQHKQKKKTRPRHSSIYDITPQAATAITSEEQLTPLRQTFEVKASTFAVFSSLLSRSSTARGSISWDAFALAMTDLGFSVNPKVGSIYTFDPPEKMAVQRSLTLHRPHQSHIDGWRLLVYSRRLKRVYGWDELTFVMS